MKMYYAVILAHNWLIFRSQHIWCNSSGPMLSIEPSTAFLRNNSWMLRLSKVAERNRDRKSTRLNSSHITISYAVFCLKKKNKTNRISDHGKEALDSVDI